MLFNVAQWSPIYFVCGLSWVWYEALIKLHNRQAVKLDFASS